MRYVFIVFTFLLMTDVCIYADTSGTLFGPINGAIGKPGAGFGGVSCDGKIDSDQKLTTHGVVVLKKTEDDELLVTITLEKGDTSANYSIEIFESASTCGLDDLADTGVNLVSDHNGKGQATVTMKLPHSLFGHETIGDGSGTESIVVVLDMDINSTSSSFNGNRFATKPIPIPLGVASTPQIEVSALTGTQIDTTFKITGTNFTALNSVIRRIEEPDGNIVTINDMTNILTDSDGKITWNFTPTCSTAIGASKFWLIDNGSGMISNRVTLNIDTNPKCLKAFAANFSVGTITGRVPLNVKFNDKSTPDVFNNIKPTSWIWNFGDGATSSEQNPEHTYLAAGTYTIGLMAGNAFVSDWEIKSNLINVKPNGTPTARFATSHFIGVAPMKVHFTDMSDNHPDSWEWNFGDDTTSNLQNPIHTYSEEGFYSVKFTAGNSVGSDTIEKMDLINVKGDGEPVAKFISDPVTGFNPLTCNFTDISNGNIGAWKWDFGDGEISLLQDPAHTYKESGIYTTKLIVDGSKGSDEEIMSIEVLDGLNSSQSLMSAFIGKPRSGGIGTEVEFADLSTGKVSGWLWDFGDNGSSTEQKPKHIYAEKGVYHISLTVFNNQGKADTTTRLAYIEIKDVEAGPEITPVQIPTAIPVLTPFAMPTATPVLTPSEEPTAMPVSMSTATPNSIPTEVAAPTSETVPSASTTPTPVEISQATMPEQEINNLLVEPTKAKRSLRLQHAIVSAIDASGNPVPGVTVKAFANGLNALVTPASAITGNDGTVLFRFRFNSFMNSSTILFETGSLTASINQE